MPLAAQSRDEPEPYSLPGEDDERRALLAVLPRRRRSTYASPGQVARHAALGAGRQLVPQADVGERAAHHHLMVAAARAVGVEVRGLDAVLDQVPPGGAVLLDRAGGRDVVGRDAVAEQRSTRAPWMSVTGRAPRACPRSRAGGARRSSPRPRRTVALGHGERVPALVARRTLAVAALNISEWTARSIVRATSSPVRPDVAQVDRLAVLVLPERVVVEVDVHRRRPARRRRRAAARRGSSACTSGLMRPSKLRLPDSTETTTRSASLTASEISSGSGPELPMHVVQP